MKAENLHSLERAEHMMVRWMTWCVVEGQKRQCGFVESSGCSECGSCCEAWQIEVVRTSGHLMMMMIY